MPFTTCTVCHRLTAAGSSRCLDHRIRRQKILTRRERGYDANHDRLRARWVPFVNAGKVACARCGKLILPGTRWHLGHKDGTDKREYQGPEHEFCSTSAGGRNKGRG